MQCCGDTVKSGKGTEPNKHVCATGTFHRDGAGVVPTRGDEGVTHWGGSCWREHGGNPLSYALRCRTLAAVP